VLILKGGLSITFNPGDLDFENVVTTLVRHGPVTADVRLGPVSRDDDFGDWLARSEAAGDALPASPT
jgi:hypothetical protein